MRLVKTQVEKSMGTCAFMIFLSFHSTFSLLSAFYCDVLLLCSYFVCDSGEREDVIEGATYNLLKKHLDQALVFVLIQILK